MMDYQTAIRGAFFDIAQVCDSAEAIPRHARYLDDGLLFIHNGKILAQMSWQEGEQFLDPYTGYTDLRASCCCPVLSIPTSITPRRR
jgi:guanine deaminase